MTAHATYLRKVVLPDLASNLVAAEIKSAELDLGNGELLRSCQHSGTHRSARRSARVSATAGGVCHGDSCVRALRPAAARTRVLRGVVLRQALVLQHMQQRGLAGVVEAKEEDFGILVGQACPWRTDAVSAVSAVSATRVCVQLAVYAARAAGGDGACGALLQARYAAPVLLRL